MKKISIIDNQKKDFLRNEDGTLITLKVLHFIEAEDWLLLNGKKNGWTNTGHYYFDWNETFKEANKIQINKDISLCKEKLKEAEELYLQDFLDEKSFKSISLVYNEILSKLYKEYND